MSEHTEQVAFFTICAYNERKHPQLKNLFAIPNAGERKYGGWMVAEGLKKGVPDIILAWPAAGFPGLFLEMKLPGKKQTPEQLDWFDRLQTAGYKCVVCFGWEEAWNIVIEYLEG